MVIVIERRPVRVATVRSVRRLVELRPGWRTAPAVVGRAGFESSI